MIKTILIYVVVSVGIFFTGMFTNSRMQREIKLDCPKCPDLKCPPNVQVNALNLEELKRLKIKGGFTYSPVYNGDVIQQNECDTIK